MIYTPKDPTHPQGTIQHTTTTGARGVWSDDVNFQFYVNPSNPNEANHWTAQAFFDGDDAHASSASNTVDFFVGD